MLQHQIPLRPRYGWRGVAVVLLLALLGALVAMYWGREQHLHERHSIRAQLLALMAQALDGQAAQAGLREQLKNWGQPICTLLEQVQPAPNAAHNGALSAPLTKVREALSAEAVYVLNAQGQVLLQQAQGTRTRLSTARQALRQRLLPSNNPEIRVQAAVSSITHERQLYVLAPLSAYCSQPALAHAVLVVQLGFAPLDALLARAGSPVLLLSPQGVVFAATRPEWVYAVAPPLTQQRIDAIAALGQFGHHFDNGVASALPFSPTANKVMVDGKPHAVQQHAMDWRDPDGLWQLVMLDDISPLMPLSNHVGYGLAAGVLLALLGLLALALLRSRAQMAATLERVQVLGTALEHSPLTVVVTDASGVIEWVNAQFERNSGYALHEVRGRKPSILASGCTPAQTYHDMWSAVVAGRVWTGQFINHRRDGSPYQEEITIFPVLNAQGQCIALVGLQQNVNCCIHTATPQADATVQHAPAQP